MQGDELAIKLKTLFLEMFFYFILFKFLEPLYSNSYSQVHVHI